MTVLATPTAVSFLQSRAERQPAREVFRFLGQNPSDVSAMTFAELDARARAIASALCTFGGAGQRAIIMCPPGFDFIAALCGCLYAGWIAVPVSPPGRAERQERVQAILRSAEPALVLTTEAMATRLRDSIRTSLGAPVWVVLSALEADANADWDGAPPEPDDVAILQYTSGSTGSPKGVMLSHANIAYTTLGIGARFALDEATRGLLWLPPFHDMGLIGGILEAVVTGMRLSLLSPTTFLRRPARWLEAISLERAHVSGGPNFGYDLCTQRVLEADMEGLDLSSWRLAFNGAEPVRSATLERFAVRFRGCGFRREAFYPCYGLAEATLMVSGGQRNTPPRVRTLDGRGVVSCGTALDGEQIQIVHPTTRMACAEGESGEIWVQGPGVALGYWNDPHPTNEIFGAEIAAAEPGRPGGSGAGGFLRTGDLGCLIDGELYITGRSKAVLLVAGRSVHAEDVEATVHSSHDQGWPGGVAALVIDDGQRERLVVLQEVTSSSSRPPEIWLRIVESIRIAVAENHQLAPARIVLVRPGTLPRTSSGKLRRDVCRAEYVGRRLATSYEWSSAAGES